MKRLFNFLFQPYTNIFYCVSYHKRWHDKGFKENFRAGWNDAWHTSDDRYLYQ